MLGAMIKEELTRDIAVAAGRGAGRCRRSTASAGAWTTPRWAARRCSGIDGAAIICHGASPVKAIKNAVRVAAEWAKAGAERAHQGRAGCRAGARAGGKGAANDAGEDHRGRRLRAQARPDQRRSREDRRHQRRVDRPAQRHPRAPHRRRDGGHLRPRGQGRPAGARARQPGARGHRLHRGGHHHARHVLSHRRQHRPAPARLPAAPARSTCWRRAPARSTACPSAPQFIQTGKYRRVLCIGAETLSRITDFTDRGHLRPAGRRRGRRRAGAVRRTSAGSSTSISTRTASTGSCSTCPAAARAIRPPTRRSTRGCTTPR